MKGERGPPDALAGFRRFVSLERDVLVLSLAMFAFSMGFQMTNRFLADYLVYLGATGFVVGAFATLGNAVGAVYPYYGGVVSDRVGSRRALTLFGFVSTLGFAVWVVAAYVPAFDLAGVAVEPWIWVFVGLLLAQCWKSFGVGGHYAVVKQSAAPGSLARGFAATETFRRTAFLVAPVVVAVFVAGGLMPGFLWVLGLAVVFGAVGTVVQHLLYDSSEDTVGREFEGLHRVLDDVRSLPVEHRPLLAADGVVRFANGMVYAFFVLVVTREMELGLSLSLPVAGAVDLSPASFFGVLLGVEMVVALVTMAPVSVVADRFGFKRVVTLGFLVYAVFPAMLIHAPESQSVLVALFAFSGLRFAGLPAHKALVVGPAEKGEGGRVTGTYYLVRGSLVIPSGVVGGVLWEYVSPEAAFTLASTVGLVGVAYYAVYGRDIELHRPVT
ncbi:MAG: MFS transporter [Halobacteriales archaeon]